MALAGSYLAKQHAGQWSLVHSAIERQLRLLRALRFPTVHARRTGFVVDDHFAAIRQPVDAIDSHLEPNALQFAVTLAFRLDYLERWARLLEFQPFADDPLDTLLFEGCKPSRQRCAPVILNTADCRGGRLSNHFWNIGPSTQCFVVADLFPDLFESMMDCAAPLARV